jgi:hypothetical protein
MLLADDEADRRRLTRVDVPGEDDEQQLRTMLDAYGAAAASS